MGNDPPGHHKCPATRPACRQPLPPRGARSEENYRPPAPPGWGQIRREQWGHFRVLQPPCHERFRIGCADSTALIDRDVVKDSWQQSSITGRQVFPDPGCEQLSRFTACRSGVSDIRAATSLGGSCLSAIRQAPCAHTWC